jgi:hypothetical protein
MEWWLLLGVAILILAVGAVTRIRRTSRRNSRQETGNIYPLW